MTDLYIALISDQLLPNLIPALMEKPPRVLLVSSADMMSKGVPRRLEKILNKNGMEVEIHTGLPSAGLERIREFALELASELTDTSITLNATGGNKLMAIAFVGVFNDLVSAGKLRIIYTDTAHKVIETLFPPGIPAVPLEAVLDVPAYLAAQGLTYRRADSDDERWREKAIARKSLTKYFAQEAHHLGDLFGVLNGLIHGNGGRGGVLNHNGEQLGAPDQVFTNTPHGTWKSAMEKIAGAGLVEWSGSKELHFNTVDAARYLSGFWLEEYAWHVARDSGLQDVRCGVEGTWEGGSKQNAPRNEFDLLAVHDNRLLVIECKTLRLDQGDQLKEQNIVTKLDSLGRNAGGTFGTSLLLSARSTTKSIQSRCNSLNIPLREARALKTLRDDLHAWRDGAMPPA
ncbi:MAG: DUF1887 family CARF protein [Pseudomonadota bacterium]|nr:DUF1887 family CARF protein [Pseudomonadota bacterium]